MQIARVHFQIEEHDDRDKHFGMKMVGRNASKKLPASVFYPKMEEGSSEKLLAIYQTTWRHVPESSRLI
jgi:hypothetical protein